MKKIIIQPGCIGCGLCAYLVPEVFEVQNQSRVRQGVDYALYAERIEAAARQCPVGVIHVKDVDEE